MHSKRLEAAAATIRRKVSSPLSISATLWLLYTASVFALLSLAVAFQYSVLVRILEDDNLRFIADQVKDLKRSFWFHGDDSQFMREEVEANPGFYHAGEHDLFYSRILDEGGTVLFESKDMATLVPAPKFGSEVPRFLSWQSPLGRTYLLMSGETRIGTSGPVRLIQVALDKTGDREVIASYRLGSLFVLLVGTTLGSLFAGQIVRHAMRPVREIERIASRISTESLSVRAGTGHWPKELSTLAGAFDLMLDRIEDGYVRLDRVSTEIAHELRSPIQILLMQTEVALTKERSVNELRQILESNIEEFQRLARMINGMLLLARANGPKAGLERRQLDVRQEFEAICEFHEALAESLGVSLLCKGEGQLLADRTLFRRAVTNLVSNALRNTPRGGQVVLSVEQPQSDTLIVKCSDTGCGIPPEKLPSIFDRGRNTGSITDLGSKGNGLGLPMIKVIANLHDGNAAVESTSAQGTVVALNFPAVQKPVG